MWYRIFLCRHRKLLTDIASLIPHMPDIEINDDRSTFLERVTSSCVIYMEVNIYTNSFSSLTYPMHVLMFSMYTSGLNWRSVCICGSVIKKKFLRLNSLQCLSQDQKL